MYITVVWMEITNILYTFWVVNQNKLLFWIYYFLPTIVISKPIFITIQHFKSDVQTKYNKSLFIYYSTNVYTQNSFGNLIYIYHTN